MQIFRVVDNLTIDNLILNVMYSSVQYIDHIYIYIYQNEISKLL